MENPSLANEGARLIAEMSIETKTIPPIQILANQFSAKMIWKHEAFIFNRTF